MLGLDVATIAEAFRRLVPGLPVTVALASIALAAGLVLGFGLLQARLSTNRMLQAAAAGYVAALRGTPLLVQIYLIYFGLGQFPAIRGSFIWPVLRDPFWCASIALSLNCAAYTSEILRGARLSVSPELLQAARALGLSRFATFYTITLPLMIRQGLPAYGNEVIALIKGSSLASTITILELTGLAKLYIAETWKPLEVFIAAATFYLGVNLCCVAFIQYWEQRFAREREGSGAAPPATVLSVLWGAVRFGWLPGSRLKTPRKRTWSMTSL